VRAPLVQHPWILQNDHLLAARDLTHTVEEMKKFNARRKFRAAAEAVSADRRAGPL
jgi:hypothetical protein